MPAAPALFAPVNSACRSKCSSAPPRVSTSRMTTTTPEALSFSPRARAGERDVDQQRDRDDQRERGDELDDRERRAVEADEPQERAGEHAQLGPEEGLEAADRAADQAAEGGLAPRRGVVVREAGTAGVVVGDEDDRACLP